ncbi:2TM domain-containing protein [Chryseobacterium formosus]|uniref:2TM domain-containing protein n=1 Tax=Chryseobacterium formosus TaxID=1537363 RepID=A0ABT3XNW3_9FLAO|nr:2TM domain-containing protein [Chryseobacterium formosus]MCX8522615.1 2TM domain-containing protein [Chryseobacterium formosus]
MDYKNAKNRVKDLKSFYKNCMWFGIVAGIILLRNFVKYIETDHVFHGSIILTVWGIILAVKAVKLFIFDAEWENKIIEKELQKTKKPINF